MNDIILQSAAQIMFVVLVTLITAFFAIHAMQHVTNPTDRAAWLLLIVPFTVFGAAFYACTKYRAFRKIGKGGLMRPARKKSFREFVALSEHDRTPNHTLQPTVPGG